MSAARHPFVGFPKEAFRFLSELAANNNKTWFEGHRETYDAAIVTPALSFVEAMGTALRAIAPSIAPEPRVGGSLFRIHRDTRFSSDKSPYKTHVGIRLRDRDTATSSRCTGPLFYVEFDATRLRVGVGVKEFDPRMLEAYRQFVARRKDGGRVFRDALQRAEREGHDILGEVLKRVPPQYSNCADTALLTRKGFFACERSSLPKVIHTPEFVDYCGRWFKPYAPLFDGLRRIARTAAD